MLTRGMPIIYYGTELMLTTTRDSSWQYGYDDTTRGFMYIQNLNKIRSGIAPDAELRVLPSSTESQLVFARDDEVFVFLTNLPSSTAAPIFFCDIELPEPDENMVWVDVLSGGKPVLKV